MAKPLRIGIVAGVANAQHCGVKDYAHQLAAALNQCGCEAEVFAPADWTLQSRRSLGSQLKARNLDVVHVQYPAIGYRYSLHPHLLGLGGLAQVTCVTLHEYTSLPRSQRLSLQLLRFTKQLILFTTAEEQRAFNRTLGNAGAGQGVIPIGSNVPFAASSETPGTRVVYFGQIRPGKGLKDFLALADLASASDLKFLVVGSVPEKHRSYAANLRSNAAPSVIWRENVPLPEIAQHLADATAAYLPFPDGATYRRGSLLAALGNGLPVMSRVTGDTPPELAAVLLDAQAPQQAMDHLHDLLRHPERRRELSQASLKLAQHFSWPAIAEQHLQHFHALLARKTIPARRAQ